MGIPVVCVSPLRGMGQRAGVGVRVADRPGWRLGCLSRDRGSSMPSPWCSQHFLSASWPSAEPGPGDAEVDETWPWPQGCWAGGVMWGRRLRGRAARESITQ